MLTQSSQAASADATNVIDASDQSAATSSSPRVHRPRRRRTDARRRMVRETVLTVDDLIYPLFVMEGEGQREEVPSMPGCFRYSLDLLLDGVKVAHELGIGAIALQQ